MVTLCDGMNGNRNELFYINDRGVKSRFETNLLIEIIIGVS